VSAWSLAYGGVAEALVKMSLGNGLGVEASLDEAQLFAPCHRSSLTDVGKKVIFLFLCHSERKVTKKL
jgi:phosphoribosylformylglycinamidine (FGAM) synthase-like enzyme